MISSSVLISALVLFALNFCWHNLLLTQPFFKPYIKKFIPLQNSGMGILEHSVYFFTILLSATLLDTIYTLHTNSFYAILGLFTGALLLWSLYDVLSQEHKDSQRTYTLWAIATSYKILAVVAIAITITVF